MFACVTSVLASLLYLAPILVMVGALAGVRLRGAVGERRGKEGA